MTKEEAREIMEMYEEWADVSCTCFMGNTPCGRCERCPPEEDYYQAKDILEGDE